jgi:hypothetical protein
MAGMLESMLEQLCVKAQISGLSDLSNKSGHRSTVLAMLLIGVKSCSCYRSSSVRYAKAA